MERYVSGFSPQMHSLREIRLRTDNDIKRICKTEKHKPIAKIVPKTITHDFSYYSFI